MMQKILMRCKQIKNVECGFTLIEIVIVLSIIGILASVAIPRIGTVQAERELAVATQQIAEGIRSMQYLSIQKPKENETTTTVSITFNTGGYKITNSTGSPAITAVALGNQITLSAMNTPFNYDPMNLNNNKALTVKVTHLNPNTKPQYVIVARETGRIRVSSSNTIQNNER